MTAQLPSTAITKARVWEMIKESKRYHPPINNAREAIRYNQRINRLAKELADVAKEYDLVFNNILAAEKKSPDHLHLLKRESYLFKRSLELRRKLWIMSKTCGKELDIGSAGNCRRFQRGPKSCLNDHE